MGLTLSDKIKKRLDERGKTVYWLAEESRTWIWICISSFIREKNRTNIFNNGKNS